MKEESSLPKIDISDDFIITNEINMDVLNLYKNYPCRLKAQIFVFCLSGNIEASINLNDYQVKANDFVTLLPGSIIQVKNIQGNPRFYIMAYSSDFINRINILDTTMDIIHIIRENPVISLPDKVVELFCDYFSLINKVFEQKYFPKVPIFYQNTLFTIFYTIKEIYKRQTWKKTELTRSLDICKKFEKLVTVNYTKERSVSFYAGKLGITLQHLSNTVKQETGKTVSEIINRFVIIDAKAQLKSTNLPIQEIAYSLNFTNVSFFGKFFKRHVGISPIQYRKH